MNRWDNATAEERLMEKVSPEPNSGCWLWIAHCGPNGYARLMHESQKKIDYAHRISFRLFVGPIPEGKDLDHLCRVRCCVNPAHLEPVTRAVNLKRGIGYGSTNFCIRGHEYTPENTYLHKRGQGFARECRKCQRLRARGAA